MNNEGLNRAIEKASHSIALEWPGVIEADDLQQELWVKILESPKYMDQLISADPALRMDLLKRLAWQIAGQYVNDYELFSGNTFYGTDHVRNLLTAGILVIAREDLAEMKETLTEFMDSQEAFEALKNRTPRYSEIIWEAYVTETLNQTSASTRKTLSRAVYALTDLMNQAHRRRHAEYEEGPGTREVISNEEARVISQRQYKGNYSSYNTFAQ